jgi:tetratricopeptide (TPR) repeat protein
VAAVLFLLAVSFVIVSKAPEHRYLATGWFLYLGTLVPVIGFVQVGAQAMADRYAYVPIIGLLVMFAWGTQDLARRLALRHSVLWVAWTVLVGLLMARSWNELPHWRNSVTLWEHAAAVTDNNYIAHNNLGNEYAHQGKPDLALAEFKKALLIEPGFASAYANIGAIQLGQGLLADARKSLETAVHLEPENANAQLNLGIVCMRMNDFGAAMDHARAALELLPYDPQAHTLAGVLFDLLGKKDDAVRELRHALELDPAYERARVNLDRIMRTP